MPHEREVTHGQIPKTQDPEARRILRTLRRWWQPDYQCFQIPERNKMRLNPGEYERSELFLILTGGYKPVEDPEIRQKLVQRSRDIYTVMLSYDDGDSYFESECGPRIELIDD